MREKETEKERERREERASARERETEREKERSRAVDDSDGLGNRIVIIVYTSVFYELSVALSFSESRSSSSVWCGGRRVSQWCARYREIASNLAHLFSDIGARAGRVLRVGPRCVLVGVRVRGLRLD